MKAAVIGLGRFGRSLAIGLSERGVEVIAVDKNRDRVEAIKDKVALAVILNSEDEEVLKAQDIDKVDIAIVSMGEEDFRSIVLTTVLLKKIGVKTVISRALEHIDKEILKNIGADRVVFPEVEMGQKLARTLASPAIVDCINLENHEDFSIAQFVSPKRFLGKTIGELQVANKYRVNIVLIKRKYEKIDKSGNYVIEEVINYVPRAEDVINEGDVLWIVGRTEDVQNMTNL
ncbi:MAG: trk/ktr system potassium uptake protein [Candidatus Poribacteria bacterium]|nr:trk/ktr system potassium uptake protein [Candidatus Poribacteria bacterium]